jgi:hypothetical protein
MATSLSYDNPSIKKSVSKIYEYLEVLKFPLQNDLKTVGGVDNIFHFWDEDKDDSTADKTALEGAAYSGAAGTDPTQAMNVCQFMKEDITVSESHEATTPSTAGLKSPFEQRMMKAMRNVKGSFEDALLNSTIASGNSTVARRMKGMKAWISTNLSAATNLTLTSAVVDDFLDKVWTSSNQDVDTFYTTASLKRKFTDSDRFAGTTRNIDADQEKIVNTVSVYVGSSEKPVVIKRHPLMSTGAMMGLHTNSWKQAFLLEPGYKPYAGDINKAGRFRLDGTLEAHNEESNFLISQGLI